MLNDICCKMQVALCEPFMQNHLRNPAQAIFDKVLIFNLFHFTDRLVHDHQGGGGVVEVEGDDGLGGAV